MSDASKVQARTQQNNAPDPIVITLPEWWISLQGEEHADVYLLVDCAGLARGTADLPPADIARSECLFSGGLAEELREVSGHLLQMLSFSNKAYFAVDLLMQCQSAIVVVIRNSPSESDHGSRNSSETQLRLLHRHFRKFNVVYDAQGQPMFFRYYDPRVLPGVLRVLDEKQLTAFFGPVSAMILLGSNDQHVEYSVMNGRLLERTVPLCP